MSFDKLFLLSTYMYGYFKYHYGALPLCWGCGLDYAINVQLYI